MLGQIDLLQHVLRIRSVGNHSISVVVTDLAGNTSTATEVAVNIDATAPIQPVVTSPNHRTFPVDLQ